jgi:hypothetical protein
MNDEQHHNFTDMLLLRWSCLNACTVEERVKYAYKHILKVHCRSNMFPDGPAYQGAMGDHGVL